MSKRLHTFGDKNTFLWRCTRCTWNDVVLNVLVALTAAGDIATSCAFHLPRLLGCIFIVECKPHVNLVNHLLRTVRRLAFLVSVNKEHTIFATTPTALVC